MSLQLFYERLRKAREDSGLTQDAMALKVGVSKRSYCAYEAGETAPSAKLLAALAEMGIDVAHLLTGQSSQSEKSAPALAPDEEILLDNYRHAPAGVRAGVKTTLETFAPGAGGCKRGKAA